MQGIGSWLIGGLLVSSACGGRSALELAAQVENGGAHFGGAPNTSGAPGVAGNRSSGGSGGEISRMPEQAGAGAAGAPSQRTAIVVSAGADMSCALDSKGGVWCWGRNDSGQLGDGTLTNSATPVRVSGIDDALTISTGGTWTSSTQGAGLSAFACAVLGDGTVQCWGKNFAWRLGSTGASYNAVPAPISGLGSATGLGPGLGVAAGNWHACALRGGSVWCWGDDTHGQLGNGAVANCVGSGCPNGTGNPLMPVRVLGLEGVMAIAGKGSDFSCATRLDGSVWCWGALAGGTGAGTTAATPVQVPGVTASPAGLAAGFQHACAVSAVDGSVQCWGVNAAGELGDGTTTSSSTPVTVRGLAASAIRVAVGLSHSCALITGGAVQCWGHNAWGELGDGSFVSSSSPVTVSGLADAVAVSAGYLHTCALTTSGSVRCWGKGAAGQLGNGAMTSTGSATPVTVLGF